MEPPQTYAGGHVVAWRACDGPVESKVADLLLKMAPLASRPWAAARSKPWPSGPTC